MVPKKMLPCLGEAARTARREAKIKTIHIAVALDRDPATVQRFERGEAWPRNPDSFLEIYARVIGVEVEDLWRSALELYLASRNGKS